eukprot:TRINITY_DN2520_c0_g2_i2.p1 TRINITY_DN2520_c0_g2~~TRINITY_DN2520_c0_g2_i2.p1  ORF type:complete len:448 (-),score=80.84 TRINITY_DN2520_c0_g2_i2:158-1468(-)
MVRLIDAKEVARHNSRESCWVILYGKVYDVTHFLSDHPGGSSIILKLAGRDATAEYDPVHPPGTLETSLPAGSFIGDVNPDTIPEATKSYHNMLMATSTTMPAITTNTNNATTSTTKDKTPPDLDTLLNFEDFESHAERMLSHKAWAYYFSAADDLHSKQLNTAAYRAILFRPRVFIDVTLCDTSRTILGHASSLPLFVCPAAMARLAHPSGEHGIAQAAARTGIIQMISNNASLSPEQILEGCLPDQTFAFQLYVQKDISKSEAMLQRVNSLRNIKILVLTLDAPTPGKRELDERAKNIGSELPLVPSVGISGPAKSSQGGIGKAMFAGTSPSLTWRDTLPWLRKHTSLPIVLKGIQTHEDAMLAAEYGCAGIILSNHGGRALDTAPPAIHTLLEMRRFCPYVFDKLEVYVDGGIKRGSDVVKAVCLGAGQWESR